MDVNLTEVLLLCQAFGRHRKQVGQPGRIINIGSLACHAARPTIAAYACSKMGVLGLTRTLAVEWARYGITVNAIVPRAVTDMTDSIPADRKAAKDAGWAGSSITLRGTPEQVAPAVIYLASEEADWVNGQVVGIAGDKLSIWTHPSEAVEAFMPGGWSLRSFRELFRATVGTAIQTLGPKD